MRNPKDRRTPHADGLFNPEEYGQEQSSRERRHSRDRRMENLTLEERQLEFSEMPSLKTNKSD